MRNKIAKAIKHVSHLSMMWIFIRLFLRTRYKLFMTGKSLVEGEISYTISKLTHLVQHQNIVMREKLHFLEILENLCLGSS